jgi:hypothetical protein
MSKRIPQPSTSKVDVSTMSSTSNSYSGSDSNSGAKSNKLSAGTIALIVLAVLLSIASLYYTFRVWEIKGKILLR